MEELVCPECGQSQFKTKASLAAHRKFAHDVDGKSAKPSFSEKVLQRLTEIEEKVDGNLNKEVSMASNEELDRVCEMFPDLCRKVDRIGDILDQHPVPNESLLEMWRQCPDCQQKLEKLIKSGAFSGKAEEDGEPDDFPWVDKHVND